MQHILYTIPFSRLYILVVWKWKKLLAEMNFGGFTSTTWRVLHYCIDEPSGKLFAAINTGSFLKIKLPI